MNNYFQELKRRHSLQQEKHKQQNQRKYNKHRQSVSLHHSYIRRNQFLTNIPNNLLQCLQNGIEYQQKLSPLKEISPPLHMCIDENQQQRIQRQQNDYTQSHLPQEHFKETPAFQLRQRNKELEGPPWSLHPTQSRKLEAIEIENKNKSLLDVAEKDMTMVYYPQWKHDQKRKFMDKPFNSTVKHKQHYITNTQDVYIDGYENLGDISRKFSEHKQNHTNQIFMSTIKERPTTPSKSLRKGFMDTVLKFGSNCTSECSTSIPKIYCKSIRQELNQLSKISKQ